MTTRILFLDDCFGDGMTGTDAHKIVDIIEKKLPEKIKQKNEEYPPENKIELKMIIEPNSKLFSLNTMEKLYQNSGQYSLILMDIVHRHEGRIGNQIVQDLRKRIDNANQNTLGKWGLRIIYVSQYDQSEAQFLLDPVYPKENILKEECCDTFLDEIYFQLQIHKQIKNMKSKDPLNEIITCDPQMLKIKYDIQKYIGISDRNVLILGESGTGKENIAKLIHQSSNEIRKEQEMVSESLAATATYGNYLYAELFGCGENVNGNKESSDGIFHVANNGNLFLDEIGDADELIQKYLLRAIEDKKVRRLEKREYENVDVRLISATRRPLDEWINKFECTGEESTFRSDLYYRVAEHIIKLPSLRERKRDIPILAQHFLEMWQKQSETAGGSSAIPEIPQKYIKILQDYQWVGNIRQLKNFIYSFLDLNRNKQKEKVNYSYFKELSEKQKKYEEYALSRLPLDIQSQPSQISQINSDYNIDIHKDLKWHDGKETLQKFIKDMKPLYDELQKNLSKNAILANILKNKGEEFPNINQHWSKFAGTVLAAIPQPIQDILHRLLPLHREDAQNFYDIDISNNGKITDKDKEYICSTILHLIQDCFLQIEKPLRSEKNRFHEKLQNLKQYEEPEYKGKTKNKGKTVK